MKINRSPSYKRFNIHSSLLPKQIRREYCRYMGQQSWLPKCLRCTQAKEATMSPQQSVVIPTNVAGTSNSQPIGGQAVGNASGPAIGTGTLQRQHYGTGVGTISSKTGSAQQQTRDQRTHNIIVERAAGLTGTLRGISTFSAEHATTSPTSSAGSTHLIYNSATPDVQQVRLG